VVAAAALIVSGMAEWAWRRATFVDFWAEHDAGNARFYHYLLLDLYPPLWALFPLAVLIAAATRYRAALLCVCVFGIALIAHSVMAWKTERYIFYVLPFFFALWGIAIGGALPWIRSRTDLLLRNTGLSAHRSRIRSLLSWGLIGAVILFAAFSSPAASYGLKMMTVDDADWRWGGYRGHPDWEAAAEATAPLLREANVVVASYDVTSLYATGRLDFMLRSAGGGGSDEGVLFGYRSKSAVPTVGSPRALEQVMDCYASGLVFIEGGHHGRSWAVDTRMVDLLEARSTRLATPDRQMYVYHWEGDGSGAGDCEAVPGIR